MARDQGFIGPLGHLRHLELHAVALGVAFDLAMAKHRQPGHGTHHRGDAKAFVPTAELIDRGPLVRVGHEVDIALQDVGVELNRLLEIATVLGIFFITQHVHEGGVVYAMHAQRTDKVAFQHPEGLGQQ